MCLWERWPRAPTPSRTSSWTRRLPLATTVFRQVWHAASSATQRRTFGISSSLVALAQNSRRVSCTRKRGKERSKKVKAGPYVELTIITSSALHILVAGLGFLCGSVSVFTTKTLGVQHQIQDALVVFVVQLNLVPLSLFISRVRIAWPLASVFW